MVALVDELQHLEREALAGLATVPDEAGLEAWRVRVLGRRGELAEKRRGLGALSVEERPGAAAGGGDHEGASGT